MIDYELFTRASTHIHLLLGAALLICAAADLYALKKPGAQSDLIAGGALFFAGLAAFSVMVALPGGGSLRGLAEAFAERNSFRVFLGLAFLFQAAGLSLLAHRATGRERGPWPFAFLLLLAGAGALFLLVPSRVDAAARGAVLLPHLLAGAGLLLAAAAKTFFHLSPRREARAAGAGLLLAAALPLLAYTEKPESFGEQRIVIEAVTAAPAK